MYQLPSDEELFAHLPGTGSWPDIQCASMADQYEQKREKVERRIQDQPRASQEEEQRQCREAMGQWMFTYLRQRKPIGDFPRDDSCMYTANPDDPRLIPLVADAIQQLRATREKVEVIRAKAIVLGILQTIACFIMGSLCYQGGKWYLAGEFVPLLQTPVGRVLVAVSCIGFGVGMVFFYISFWPCAASVLIMLTGLVDRRKVRDEFADAVVVNVPSVYLYLRFCQLWCDAKGKPLPEEVYNGLLEVQESVALYNKVA